METGQQNPNLTFDQLYEQARGSVSTLGNTGNSILADIKKANPDLVQGFAFELGPLKEVDRAQAKIRGDYKGDTSKISDLVRGRFVVENADQVEALQKYISDNADKLGIEVVKDQFAKPTDTGFRAINTKIRLPNEHVAELRVEHKGMLQAAKHTHEPYEKVQEIERRAKVEKRDLTPDERLERQQLLDQVRDIHGKPATDGGLDRLLNDEGREKVAQFEAERVAPHIQATPPEADVKTAVRPRPVDVIAETADTVKAGDAGSIQIDPKDISPDPARQSGLLRAADAISDFGKRGGIIGGTVMGSIAGGVTFIATGSAEDAAKTAVATAIPMGETLTNVATGADADTTIRTAKVEAASEAGSIGGAVAGAAAGAAIGSVVPIIGTAIGGIAGGLIGAFAGGYGAAAFAEITLKDDFNQAAGTGKVAPTQEVSLNADDVRQAMQELSEEQAQKLSPEAQSLYAFKDNPERFHKQFAELEENEGISHVQDDMPDVREMIAENTASSDVPYKQQQASVNPVANAPTMA